MNLVYILGEKKVQARIGLAKIAQQMRLSPDNCNNSWTAPSAETNGWKYGKCLLVKYDDELVPIVTA